MACYRCSASQLLTASSSLVVTCTVSEFTALCQRPTACLQPMAQRVVEQAITMHPVPLRRMLLYRATS